MPLKIKIKKNLKKRQEIELEYKDEDKSRQDKDKSKFYLVQNDETQEAKQELQKQSNNYVLFDEEQIGQKKIQQQRWDSEQYFNNNKTQIYDLDQKPQTRKRLKSEILQKINRGGTNSQKQVTQNKKIKDKVFVQKFYTFGSTKHNKKSESYQEYLKINKKKKLQSIRKQKVQNISKIMIFQHSGSFYRSRTICSTIQEGKNEKGVTNAFNFIVPLKKQKQKHRQRQNRKTKQFVRSPSLKRFSESGIDNKLNSHLQKRKSNYSRLMCKIRQNKLNQNKSIIEKNSAIRDQFQKLKRILNNQQNNRQQMSKFNFQTPMKIIKY